jgi:uncharacterized protein YcfJ
LITAGKSKKKAEDGEMEGQSMIRTAIVTIALVASGLVPERPAAAQDSTMGGAILGGAAGAIIGGAATGRAGGAVAGGIIGAATGAMIGSQLEPRPGGYYWYDDRCWVRYRDGSYHRVSSRNCY